MSTVRAPGAPVCRYRSPRRRGPVAVLVVLAFLLAGCGIGAESAPNFIPKSQVPFGLLGRSTPTTAVTAESGYVTVYLVGPQRLVAVSVLVKRPVGLSGALHALGKGPTSQEAGNGLLSPVSTAAPLTVVGQSGSTVTIEVGKSFTTLAGQEQVLAAAQVVYTATAFPGVDAVRLRIGKQSASVPTGSGNLSAAALTRSDYEKVAPI